jgi:ERCC4-type nuclease
VLLIDDRTGSKHYAALIPNSVITRLESGDVAFEGNGVTVGVEIKKILDAVSCMYSGRLADHQIPLMRQMYDVCYLIVEGLWRPEPESGILQYYKGELGKWGKWLDVTSGRKRLLASSFELWLSTMEIQGGLRMRTSISSETTASLLMSLYQWWQREDHSSFNVLQEATGDTAVLSRPTMLRRMIALLPRVGWERSKELSQRFRGVRFIRNNGQPARLDDWYIPNEIAEATAIKIQEACDGTESSSL